MPKNPKGFGKFDTRKRIKVSPLGDGMRVRVIGNHPHAGKEGTIKGGMQTSTEFPDWQMWEVRFEDGSRCLADEDQIALVT
jgi:hypothetical protein